MNTYVNNNNNSNKNFFLLIKARKGDECKCNSIHLHNESRLINKSLCFYKIKNIKYVNSQH